MDITLDHDIMPRDWSEENSIIKVIGVGGGGCNAVNYMYKQKIKGIGEKVKNGVLEVYDEMTREEDTNETKKNEEN